MQFQIRSNTRLSCFGTFLLGIMSLLVPTANGSTPESPRSASRPNVILLMADDLGWGDLHCFNNASPIMTPNIDAMAANGLMFQRFYAAAPVCSPTRGSCLTGRHPYRYGIYSANIGHIKADEVLLPELLRGIGYATGHFGKWHLGTLTTEIKDANRGGPAESEHYAPPQNHGYDVCFTTESKVPTYDPLHRPANAPSTAWDALESKQNALFYGTRYWNENGESVDGLEGDDSAIIAEAALNFISRSVASDKPFFATIWFHAPHLPVVADPRVVNLYSKYDVYHRNYYGCITSLDAQIGRLRGELRKLGISEETMIWFCSDNGPEGKASDAPGSAGPFRGRKRDLYEGGVRVPAILEWPGKVAPRTTEFPAVTSDYLPTIVDYLGIPLPSRQIDGISLRPMIEQFEQTRNSAIFFQSAQQFSMVTDQYKLISVNRGETWELFDLQNDPEEKRSLTRELPGKVAEMTQELRAWVGSIGKSQR